MASVTITTKGFDVPTTQHGFQVKQQFFQQESTAARDGCRDGESRTRKQGSLLVSEQGFNGLLRICDTGSMPSIPSVPQGTVQVVGTAHTCGGVRRLVKSVMRGLKACQEPSAAVEGMGGTYFFLNEAGRKVAICKPCDEEPLAPNNPKGFVGRALGEPGLKPTVRVGEAAMREVAAFLLDHDHFAGVPHTVLVKMTHRCFHEAPPPASGTLSGAFSALAVESPSTSIPCKLGSLQEFVVHDSDTNEVGASLFSRQDVHRIGILDIRLFNTDRHAGNILVRRHRGSASELSGEARLAGVDRLIPIDHGFCLPEALEPPYFEWLFWPQAMLPFGPEELEYIRALDPAADCQMLRQALPSLREECLRTLEVATTVLKMCAGAGMSLSEIGQFVSRPLVGLDEDPSELEKICFEAKEEVSAGVEGTSEDDSEGSDSGDDAEGMARIVGMPVKSLSRGYSRVVPQSDLLFDLEEEHAVSDWADSPEMKGPLMQSSLYGEPASPSPDSVIGINFEPCDHSFGSITRTSSTGSGWAGTTNELPREMATSAQGTIGFNWPLANARERAHPRPRRKTRAPRQVYPPPVQSAAPTAMNVSFADMGAEEWSDFMAAMRTNLEARLSKKSAPQGIIGGRRPSVPNFNMSCAF